MASDETIADQAAPPLWRRVWNGLRLEGSFGFEGEPAWTPGVRIAVVLAAGFAAAIVSWLMAHPIRFEGTGVGDIGPPIVAIKLLASDQSPFALTLRTEAITLYPLTTSVVLSPLLLLPVALWAPTFTGLGTALLAAGVLWKGRPWQLLVLATPCYFTAVHAVQWSPHFAAALLLPPLLSLAVVKPQLGLVLVACGRLNFVAIVIGALVVAASFLLMPSWPLAWLREGNLGGYLGRAPVTFAPGLLLVSSVLLWRRPRARLLLMMSLIRQRYYYDQLLLFLVPRTWRQMLVLVISSWIGFAGAWCLHPVDLRAGAQHEDVWLVLLATLYLPALGLVWFNAWQERRED